MNNESEHNTAEPFEDLTEVADAPSTDEDVAPPENPPKKTGGGLALPLSLLALLLSVGGIGAGYYTLNARQGQQADTSHQILALSERLDNSVADLSSQIDQKLAALNQSVTAQLSRIAEEQTALAQRQQALEDHLTLVRNQASWSKRDWSLAEINYLAQIASDRLRFMRDRETAIAALQTAQSRLERLADPSLSSLRQQLRRDIQNLKAYHPDNSLESLTALENEIARLQPLPGEPEKAPDSASPQDNARPKSLRGAVAEALSKRFRIRHHERPLNALTHNAVGWQALSLLQLKMEALRLALQQDNPVMFKQILLSIRQWANDNLAPESRAPLLAAIDALDPDQIFTPPPTLNDTQAMLRTLLSHTAP